MTATWTKQKAKELTINYRNAERAVVRGHGCHSQLSSTATELIWLPGTWPITFAFWFLLFFVPCFSGSAYFFAPDPNDRWIFVFAGPVNGLLIYGVIHWITKRDVDAGPYLKVDLVTKTIMLPRYEKSFAFHDVDHLQLIYGTEQSDAETSTDLNLIVQQADGPLVRYLIVGNPTHKQIETITSATELPVIETDMGWKTRRDLDISSRTE